MIEQQKSNRRRFIAGLGAAYLTIRRASADDPFASVSPELWRNARWNGLIMIHRPAPANLSWRTQLTADREPGEPLVASGQLFAPDGRTPAAGVTVYAYNTDAQGYYGENRTEYPPRIYGWMKTDAAGRFELRTVRPGRYPDMHVPAHIHFNAWGGGYPLQWMDELRFEGDSYLTQADLAQDAQRGEFRTIQPVSRRADGTLSAQIRIKLSRETTYR